jgi:uncharacterized protein involved in propanediol utilization
VQGSSRIRGGIVGWCGCYDRRGQRSATADIADIATRTARWFDHVKALLHLHTRIEPQDGANLNGQQVW